RARPSARARARARGLPALPGPGQLPPLRVPAGQLHVPGRPEGAAMTEPTAEARKFVLGMYEPEVAAYLLAGDRFRVVNPGPGLAVGLDPVRTGGARLPEAVADWPLLVAGPSRRRPRALVARVSRRLLLRGHSHRGRGSPAQRPAWRPEGRPVTARLTGDQLAAEWDDRAQELRGRAADRDATEMPEDEGAAVVLRACADP